MLFTLARYAEVTAPALYGRGVNLYWDARHVGGVVGMLVQVAPPWQVLAVFVGIVLALAAGGWLLGRCVARIARALDPRAPGPLAAATRRRAGVRRHGACCCCSRPIAPARSRSVASAISRSRWPRPGRGRSALLGGSWLANRETRALATAAGGSQAGGGAVVIPVLHTPAAAGPRPDVYVVFVESYGAVAWQRADIAARLVESRARLAASIARTGRGVVSAWVRSPTFGSGSWLAHASLIAGTEVRDGDDYARLLLRPRTRLTEAFRADGYRVLALMPGLRQAWPEGEYFRFDAIYGATQLDYRGPEFGWWRIPDQFALARLDQLEGARPAGVAPAGVASIGPARAPRFVFFPTISSHMPFRPTPPYQPDWERVLGPEPYGEEAARAIAQSPDWLQLGPAYADSLAYAQRTLAGYLERRVGQPLVMLLLGDHQPPAAVSGEGAIHGRAGARDRRPSRSARGAAGAGLRRRPRSIGARDRADARARALAGFRARRRAAVAFRADSCSTERRCDARACGRPGIAAKLTSIPDHGRRRMPASVHTEVLRYTAGGVELASYLAVDTSTNGRRPALAVYPEWWGLNDYARRRARELAQLGCVAIAVDVYGGGREAADSTEAGTLMNGLFADMAATGERVKAAIEQLRKHPLVDPTRVGAMGYCLGGALALHAARLGVDLKGVVSFHGSLGRTHVAKKGEFKPEVLICHGEADALVPAADQQSFHDEMAELAVPYQFISYPGAKHGFSNPEATDKGKKYNLPLAYDEKTDRQSWEDMKAFWQRVFR